jgi:hypothetical protein
VQNLKKHIIQFALNLNLLRSDTDESVTQFEKHDDPRILTLHGIIIDGRDEYEKTEDSIRVNTEFTSNNIEERHL